MDYEVVAFTATQIPDIEGRKYPAELAGEMYPEGIPIYAEEELEKLIKELDVDDCVFSYSDVSYQHVMNMSSVVAAAGANFVLLGPGDTQIKSSKPLISVGAVRTGCGKSQTSRRIIEILMAKGLKVVAIRHPMPYGDIAAQKVMRFASVEDIDKNKCTVEEMEEYEPHVIRGNVIYSGVDYEAIIRAAENDPDGCDVVLWDGGNNDFPFYKSDLHVTVVDPHRPGHELTYHPGETTLRLADVVVINKMGKKVLVVEDGPTLTHGEMKIGAGVVAAEKFGAAGLVDPRPYTVGRLTETFEKYPEIGTLLPAMGYGEVQLKDMETTINNTECDAVVVATPIDLNRILKIDKPNTRVFYDLQEIGSPNFEEVLADFGKKHNLF
ncbi:MAG: GTPase [Deltaproteobacteria bacterium]|nr:GTPase [Deltaproteobacteria bacterium]